jgi:acetyl esterase/lipase
LTGAAAFAQVSSIPQTDSSFIDNNGTAHVTRVVPVPKTISSEAQETLARKMPDNPPPQTLAQRREHTDAWQVRAGEAARKLYPVNLSSETIAGVPVRVVTPTSIPEAKRDRVLLNLHGGGFNSDSGSLSETIPIANLTQTKVIAVLYRLSPEHPFPAAVDDAVAVYRELIKNYRPEKIALYGTSAGAILTAEVAVKLRQLGLPLPGAMGVFSGNGDFTRYADSQAIYGLSGLKGPLQIPGPVPLDASYVGNTDRHDPVLSPLFADLHGFPPTLFVTSTRDLLLSNTATLHRAFLNAGVDAELVVFEALPHAFWNDASLPESKEADHTMAAFFDKHLGG